MEIFKIFQRHKLYYLIYATLVLTGFSVSILILNRIPGIAHEACSNKGALNTENLIFSFLFLSLFCLLIIGIIEQIRLKQKDLTSTSTGFLALILGSITSICTVCFAPTISFVGISFGFGIFHTYNLEFKIISILCMILAIYFLEKNLRKVCKICNIN